MTTKVFVFFTIFLSSIQAQTLHVDTVKVDSIWNSDSSWYDSLGILQNRTSRDAFLSFFPSSQGSVACSLSISLDSGRTWDKSPNPLRVIDTSFGNPTFPILVPQLSKPFSPGTRKKYRVRIFSGDRDGVLFRVVGRQYVPSLLGNPRKIYIGGPVDSVCHIPLQVNQIANNNAPQSHISKYYWDFLGDGFVDDSTAVGTIVWTINIPDYTQSGFSRRATIVRAKDINGILSPAETLTVDFRQHIIPIKIDTIIVGSNQSIIGSSINFDVPEVLAIGAARLNDSLVDLLYAFSSSSNYDAFWSPDTAHSLSYTLFDGWNKYNSTSFYKTNMQPNAFDTISYSYQIPILWDSTKIGPKKVPVSLNDIYLVKTDKAKIILFRVAEMTQGSSGTVKLFVYQ